MACLFTSSKVSGVVRELTPDRIRRLILRSETTPANSSRVLFNFSQM
jgi:hypothetical protein